MDPFKQIQDDKLETTYKSTVPDTGCSLEDQPEEVDDRDGWRKRVRDMCADNRT